MNRKSRPEFRRPGAARRLAASISRAASGKCPGAPMIMVDLVCDNPRRSLAAHAAIATAIADAFRTCGTCQPGDLLAKGFTREEATVRWPVAKALAAIVWLMDLS